jgi:hypothetical protein
MNRFLLAALLATLFVSAVGASTAIQNGSVVVLGNTASSNCTSTPALLYQNFTDAVAASAVTDCEIGIGFSSVAGLSPYYMLNPAFAGLSMYGTVMWNATDSGYPVFRNETIVTTCGASGTPTGCNSTKKYFYSYTSSAWETQMGITSGVMGLPEGVLPRPAHDILLPSSIGPTPVVSYLVRVWVFDPNIFPNPVTGRCMQLVASNLSNPTGNCLNSTAALSRAIATTSTAVVAANKNNVLFISKNILPSGGLPPVQAVIIYDVPTVKAGKTAVAMYSSNNTTISNTNLKKTLFVVTGTPETTAMQSAQATTAAWLGIAAAAVAIIVVVMMLVGYFLLRKRKR